MNVYAAGTDVTVVIPLTDSAGAAYSATAVDYAVTDEAGNEIVARTAAPDFVSGDLEVTLEILAASNQVVPGALRSAREIKLFLTLEEPPNSVTLRSIYVLEELETLVVGVNTVQLYPEATLTARDIGNVTGWDAADEEKRIAALKDAWTRLCQLRYEDLYAGQPATTLPAGGVYSIGDLAELTADELLALPSAFLAALKKAQVAEADNSLTTDPTELSRRRGLILETIGEVKQMWRSNKPYESPVSRRAINYLAKYITYSVRVARG